MTHWTEYSAADFDRARARKGTRARPAEPGLFHLPTPVERPGKIPAGPGKRMPEDVPLFGTPELAAPAGTAGHEPDPEPDPERGPWDVCRHCGRIIREAPELAAWVTTTSRNPECYRRD